MKRVNHSQLQPEMDAAVQAFRAELVAEREEQERRLRDALDYFNASSIASSGRARSRSWHIGDCSKY